MSSNNTRERALKEKSATEGYPALEPHTEKIFVIAKTYPNPSIKYIETVCTAGITTAGKLIRLYPISFRYLASSYQYHKYQWIEAGIEKHKSDTRIDSYRPTKDTLRTISGIYPTKESWKKRREVVLPSATHTSIEDFLNSYEKHRISLGIFKPKEMLELKIESDDLEWSPKHLGMFRQPNLFGELPKSLEKIPYKFSYIFICQDNKCRKSHKIQILDWEIYQLYRNLKNQYHYSADIILKKIKDLWLEKMWSSSRDSYLIVGTHSRFATPLILGVFWPPKIN